MGYIEETGAAQHLRDARIAAIYEGANGVQAIDLVQRKLPLSGGATVAREIAGMRAIAAEVAAKGGADFGATAARLGEAIDALERATQFLSAALGADMQDALAGATPYLKSVRPRARRRLPRQGGACRAKARRRAAMPRNWAASRSRASLPKRSQSAPAALKTAIRSGAGALQQFEAALAEAT